MQMCRGHSDVGPAIAGRWLGGQRRRAGYCRPLVGGGQLEPAVRGSAVCHGGWPGQLACPGRAATGRSCQGVPSPDGRRMTGASSHVLLWLRHPDAFRVRATLRLKHPATQGAVAEATHHQSVKQATSCSDGASRAGRRVPLLACPAVPQGWSRPLPGGPGRIMPGASPESSCRADHAPVVSGWGPSLQTRRL